MKSGYSNLILVLILAAWPCLGISETPGRCAPDEFGSWKSSAERILHEIGGDDLQAYFGFVPKVRILDTFAPNAFALESGEVVVSQGLLDLVRSPSELAFVIAHELAHLVLGHQHRTVPAEDPSAKLEAQVLMELEADRVAIDLLRSSGHQIGGVAEGFLTRLGSYGKERGAPLASIFPSLQRRISQFASLRSGLSGS